MSKRHGPKPGVSFCPALGQLTYRPPLATHDEKHTSWRKGGPKGYNDNGIGSAGMFGTAKSSNRTNPYDYRNQRGKHIEVISQYVKDGKTLDVTFTRLAPKVQQLGSKALNPIYTGGMYFEPAEDRYAVDANGMVQVRLVSHDEERETARKIRNTERDNRIKAISRVRRRIETKVRAHMAENPGASYESALVAVTGHTRSLLAKLPQYARDRELNAALECGPTAEDQEWGKYAIRILRSL